MTSDAWMTGNAITWNWTQLTDFFFPRILAALVCGGIVGFERELKGKAAGIKTNILICLGATLYTCVSLLVSEGAAQRPGDPARIAAQIVSGIGFLGGGAIIQARGTVLGLTTAATIWMVAAMGICVGLGRFDVALLCSLMTVSVLVATSWFEDRVLGRSTHFSCEIITVLDEGLIRNSIHQSLLNNGLVLEDYSLTQRGDSTALQFRYSGARQDQKKFLLELWSISGVKDIRQI